MFNVEGDIGIRLFLIDEASKQLTQAKAKIGGILSSLKGATLTDINITGKAFSRYGGMITKYGEDMVATFAEVDEATATSLTRANMIMDRSNQQMGRAFAPTVIATKNAASSLGLTLAKLPKPLLEAGAGFVYVGGKAMATIGPILSMAASMGKLAEMGILTKARMVSMGLALGATMAFMGALTTDSNELRIGLSALTAVLIAYTAREWLSNIAKTYSISLWTMGVGVVIALTAAIAGITYMMHQNQSAEADLAEESLALNLALDDTAASFDGVSASANISAFLLGSEYAGVITSLGGQTTVTMGNMFSVTNTTMDGMTLKITDSMGNMYDVALDKVAGMEGVYEDGMGNIYTLTDDGMGNTYMTVKDNMGNTYTVSMETLGDIENGWNGTWQGLGTDKDGVLANLVGAISGAGDAAGTGFADGLGGGLDAATENLKLKVGEWKGLFFELGEALGTGSLGKAAREYIFGPDSEWVYDPTLGGGTGVYDYSTGQGGGPSLFGPFGDMLWKSGETPVEISPDDNVIAFKGSTVPGVGGGANIQITIGSIIASSYEGGREAGRGLREELARRGVGFTL